MGQGSVLSGVIDNYPQPLETPVVALAVEKVQALLDIPVDSDIIQSLLESIGLQVAAGDTLSTLQVTVPSFRPDLEREVDLIEEVARLYGYEQIPTTMPVGAVDAPLPPLRQRVAVNLRNAMVANGFSESMNYSFISAEAVGKLGIAGDDPRSTQVEVLNPLSEDQAVMRTSLVPSLLETVSRNLAYRSRDLRLFELRPVFLPQADSKGSREDLFLTAVICGRRQPEGWAQSQDSVDFYDLKGVAEGLLAALNIDQVVYTPEYNEAYLHPGKSCRLLKDGQFLGSLGEVHPAVLTAFDIDLPVYLLELDVEKLLAATGQLAKFKPLSRFPDVMRDSALLLDETVSAGQVTEIIKRCKVKYLENAVLFDLYTGKGIPEGKKSLAVRVRYRDQEKTLTEEEVSKVHSKLIGSLCHQLGAEIR